MTTELLRRYIFEYMMSQNVVRKDPEGSGNLVLRKLVTYEKPSSRFAPGDDVDTELKPDGSVKVDDMETWKPDFVKTIRKVSKRHKRVTKLA